MKRRDLIKRALGATAFGAAILAGLSRIKRAVGMTKIAPVGQAPTRPPGALNESSFRAACTRCFLCGEACPRGAIQFPERIEGAQIQLRGPPAPIWLADETPYVLSWETACSMCLACTTACPTGALRPLTEPTQVEMGTARVDRKICLPWTKTSWCGACYTACPLKDSAITVDYRNRPEVQAEHCTGCGLCVEVCPIKYKAIAVVPPFAPDSGSVRAE